MQVNYHSVKEISSIGTTNYKFIFIKLFKYRSCGKNTDKKLLSGGKSLFGFTLSGHCPLLRKVRGGTQAGTQSRHQEGAVLAGWLNNRLTFSYLSQVQPTSIILGMVKATVIWNLLHQLAIKKSPTDASLGQSDQTVLPPRLPYPR